MEVSLEINQRCISCDLCRVLCPENAIINVLQEYIVESWACTMCHICVEVCPAECIKVVQREPQVAGSN